MLGSRKGQPTRRAFLQSAAALAVRPPGGTSHEASEERDFLEVPNSYRLRMHWYIFGPAWTAEECDRQLKLMAVAHVGGVLIFPTYPIAVDDPEHGIQNQSYLSAEFFSVLNSVLGTCKKLGLTADMVLGTGWPYGGPSVALADSAPQTASCQHSGHDLRAYSAPGARRARQNNRGFLCGPESCHQHRRG